MATECQERIVSLISLLSDEQREVLRHIYAEGLTQAETAAIMGRSQQWVSKVESAALETARQQAPRGIVIEI